MMGGSSSNQGLRQKMRAVNCSESLLRDATRIIILDNEKISNGNPLSSEALAKSSALRQKSWADNYSLKELESLGLLTFYREMLKVLFEKTDRLIGCQVREEIRNALQISIDSSTSLKRKDVFPARLRKQLFRRLYSLLNDFGPIAELMLDASVQRVVLTHRSQVRIHKLGRRVSSSNIFACEEEARLFIACMRTRFYEGGSSVVIHAGRADFQFFVESVFDEQHKAGSLIIKKLPFQGVTLLDLIRRKMISPDLARSLSRVTRESLGGVFIMGGRDTGKSSLLGAFMSTLSSQRIPLLIDYSGEVRCSHANMHGISREELERAVISGRIDEKINSIMSLGITDIFVDVIDKNIFSFVSRAFSRYPVQVYATGRGVSFDAVFASLSNEYYLDSESFAKVFPLCVLLEDDLEGPYLSKVVELSADNRGNCFSTIVDCLRSERVWSLIEDTGKMASIFSAINCE
ncbi:MAG TPA: hypothetical protein PKA63_13280 [Oligoflexia bacterium]|nr:hypothetical protein [Oligoflexia bacterium]HMP49633.1 hypothetical protein [Oligoflexia bacterium]